MVNDSAELGFRQRLTGQQFLRRPMGRFFGVIDSKSIKNTDTAKGYDAGKTSGIKLHTAVDTSGLPHAVWVTTANVTGMERLKCCANAPRTRQKWRKPYVMAVTAGKTLLTP
jgi:hypothetical protein